MKRVLLFIMLALGTSGLWQAMAQTQTKSKPFVHCIVLDKTLSMVGRDGTKQGTTNIWDDVQNYCCGMIDGFSPSSTVVFYTFDKGLYGPEVFEIKGEADKTAIKNKVRDVTVDGQYTWIASNLAKVIEAVYKQYEDHSIMIYLLTDGIEEQQPCNIQKVIDGYEGYVGDYDHLYYVDLRGLLSNSKNPTTKEFKDAFENGRHTDIVDGFPKIVSMSPMFPTIPHEIKENEEKASSFTVDQVFEVTSGELTKDFSFEASINNGSVKGVKANFKITPSKVSIADMKPDKNKGMYRVTFEIENVSNVSLFDCTIPIQLKGCTGEKTLTIEPSSFVIELVKQPDVLHDTLEIHDTVVVEKTVIIEAKDKEQTVTVKHNKYSRKNKTKE